VVTLSAALILQNYWALVIGAMSQSVLSAAASYLFHPFRPRFSLAKREELLGVSLWMFLASASQTVHRQFEKMVVGRIASRNALGLYSVSRDLSSIFTEEITTALNRVTFVTTARTGQPLSADPDRLVSMLGAYSLIAAPLGFGLAATADHALPLLLGPQWTGAAPLLAIIAPACALHAVYNLIVVTLQASGDARAAAYLAVAGAVSIVAVTAGVALTGYGAGEVALGALVTAAVFLAAGITLLARKAETSMLGLLMSVMRPFGAATLMMFALLELETGHMAHFPGLVIEALAGAALFAFAAFALWVGQGRPEGAEKVMFALARRRSQELLFDRA
jgi:O-antigen/teichoic acid export membrane protein